MEGMVFFLQRSLTPRQLFASEIGHVGGNFTKTNYGKINYKG